jgi:hypothetical protein
MTALPLRGWLRAGIALPVVWAIVGSLWTSPLVAQTSKEYALMGKKAYSAFECSMLASYARNDGEQRRLFEIGYAQGKTFIEALTSGKVKPEDVNSTVPIGVTLALQGPNADFVLGQVWASAAKDVYDEIYRGFPDNHLPSNDEKALAADNRFSSENCALIR